MSSPTPPAGISGCARRDTIPGDRTVLHHVLVGVYDPKLPERQRMIRATSGELGAYVPGNGPVMYPAGHRRAGAEGLQLRLPGALHLFGQGARDETRVGFYFAKEPPQYEFKTAVLLKPSLNIPANTKAYTDSITQEFPREVMVYSLTPHAHYRGVASKFVATYPDGREELLLSVPKYDFNWQTTYSLTTPKVVPAGTRIVHSTTYDNSTQNPANPDPNRVVPWGEQSWDEMLYGVVRYREMTPLTTQVTKVAENQSAQAHRGRVSRGVAGLGSRTLLRAFFSTFMNRSLVSVFSIFNIMRRPPTAGTQKSGTTLVTYLTRVVPCNAGLNSLRVSLNLTSLRSGIGDRKQHVLRRFDTRSTRFTLRQNRPKQTFTVVSNVTTSCVRPLQDFGAQDAIVQRRVVGVVAQHRVDAIDGRIQRHHQLVLEMFVGVASFAVLDRESRCGRGHEGQQRRSEHGQRWSSGRPRKDALRDIHSSLVARPLHFGFLRQLDQRLKMSLSLSPSLSLIFSSTLSFSLSTPLLELRSSSNPPGPGGPWGR